MAEGGLRVNTPHVIHETIDGEVIVINLASGNYYSVKGAGADVWDVLQSSPGADVNAIAEAVARRYDRPSEAVESAIEAFVATLKDEELVAAADGVALSSIPTSNGPPAGAAANGFEPPLLEKYTDMQDLVLLDPVHEVDATGWPHQKPDVSQTP
jgi:Coenzyme PQQ synthesis protein D (PqqD)